MMENDWYQQVCVGYALTHLGPTRVPLGWSDTHRPCFRMATRSRPSLRSCHNLRIDTSGPLSYLASSLIA
jgi:hypothetical protein